MNAEIYRYSDFMSDDFPFKLHVRSHTDINLIKHAHEHLQICYVTKGEVLHRVLDKEAVLTKGSIISVPPFLEHGHALIDGQPFEMVQIDFMPFFINENMRDLTNMYSFVDFAYIEPILTIDDKLLPKMNLSFSNQRLVEQLIDNMRKELQEREDGYRLSIKADLLKLLIVVGRAYQNYISGRQENQLLSTQRKEFYDTIDYMKTYFNSELRLEAMAGRAAMAPTYFSHMFKTITGRTFTEYLNDLRIEEAIRLLNNTDKSVTEICFSVGFNHIGHFYNIFKKKTGLTPSQFRKHARYTLPSLQ